MTFVGFLTVVNSTYLLFHGTLKILNRCGFTLCIERHIEDIEDL